MNLNSFIDQGANRELLQRVFSKGVKVIYQDALELLSTQTQLLNRLVSIENPPSEITAEYLHNLRKPAPAEPERVVEREKVTGLKVLKNYTSWDSATPEAFFSNFYSRYMKLSQMLSKRPQLKGVVSIAQLSKMRGRDRISVIGMVSDIRTMKDGRKIIEVEDPTGKLSVLLSGSTKNKDSIVLDDVIGVRGQAGRGIIFADEVVYPDIPFSSEWPSGESDVLVISDIHAGSKKFNEEMWDVFADYVNKEKDIKYVVVSGDLVDGIGIYQGQEKELDLTTADEQYDYLAELMRKLRRDVLVVAIPGNHDPSRDGEPQPKIPEEFAEPLYKINNLKVLSNPSWLCIEGVTFLVYHGTSLDGLIDSIESLRGVAYENPSKAQIELLKKRHLSPIFGRNKVFPDREDYLVIDKVPNVFITGHVHTMSTATYRGVRLISAGTFQERTAFQEKLGHHPTPGKFVRLSLKTGKMSVVDFSSLVSRPSS